MLNILKESILSDTPANLKKKLFNIVFWTIAVKGFIYDEVLDQSLESFEKNLNWASFFPFHTSYEFF